MLRVNTKSFLRHVHFLFIIIGRVLTILISAEANSHTFIMTGDSFELPNSLEDKILLFFVSACSLTAAPKNCGFFQGNSDCTVVTVTGLKPWSPDSWLIFSLCVLTIFTSSAFIFETPTKKKSLLPWNVWGWVQLSKLRCPLTVRLTSRLLEVIDWVVLGPPRALSAALEVRGHLLCKSASFCTVATPVSHHQPHPLTFLLFSPPCPSALWSSPWENGGGVN